ncbi:hypothetical protein [Mycolicibacterium thermoresistibile]
MRGLMRGAVVAASGVLMAAGLGMGTAAADYDDGRVPLSPILRNCDHGVRSYFAPSGTASAYAIVNNTGNAVTADITVATAARNTAYQVKLIQMPRAASTPCNPGDPGVTAGVLHTDYAGGGHLRLTGDRMADSTGAWVEISRPAPHSLVPTEYYTSDIVSRF